RARRARACARAAPRRGRRAGAPRSRGGGRHPGGPAPSIRAVPTGTRRAAPDRSPPPARARPTPCGARARGWIDGVLALSPALAPSHVPSPGRVQRVLLERSREGNRRALRQEAQQRLYFLPLPQGHGSLRPTRSARVVRGGGGRFRASAQRWWRAITSSARDSTLRARYSSGAATASGAKLASALVSTYPASHAKGTVSEKASASFVHCGSAWVTRMYPLQKSSTPWTSVGAGTAGTPNARHSVHALYSRMTSAMSRRSASSSGGAPPRSRPSHWVGSRSVGELAVAANTPRAKARERPL